MKFRTPFWIVIAAFFSIVFALASASSILAYFPGLLALSQMLGLGVILVIFLCAGSVCYLALSLAQPWLRHLNKSVIIISLLLSVGLGVAVREQFSFLEPPLSRINIDRLLIQNTGLARRASSGSEVAIEYIEVNRVRVPWSDFIKTGTWEENQKALASDTSSRLKYQFSDYPPFQKRTLKINFLTGPRSGRVIVTTFKEHIIDLYRPTPGEYPVEVSFYTGSIWPVSDKLLLSAFFFFGLTFLLHKRSQKPGSQASEPPSPSFLDILLAVALGALMLVACLYMSPRGSSLGFVDLPHDGYQLCTALDLKQGGMIFRDTFSQYGPFPDYLNALALSVFGFRLLSLKVFASLVYALILFCQYLLSRSFLARFPAAISSLALILCSPIWVHGVMVSPHLYATLFQMLGLFFVLKYIRSSRPAWLLGAGVFTGIMWGMKQNIGTYHWIALFVFVISLDLIGWSNPSPIKERLRKCLLDLSALGGGFAAVIAITLIWLAVNHALPDWYRQTILLPPAYVFSSQPLGPPANHWIVFLTTFFMRSVTQFITLSFSYIFGVFRLVIIGCGIWQLSKRHEPDQHIILLAMVAFFAWFGTIPSGVISHQWWSIAATFGVAGWLLWKLLSPFENKIKFLFYLLIFSLIIYQQVDTNTRTIFLRIQEGRWDMELSTPSILAGMRSDAGFGSFLKTLGQDLSTLQEQHPDKPLLTIGSIYGESNLFQAFSGECASFHPAYWNVEGIISKLYPDYFSRRDAYIRAEKPLLLIIEPGADRPPDLSTLGVDYTLLKSYSQDNGYQTLGDYRKFSLYAPAQ